MKRALVFVLLALSMTGCAVRAQYYGPDRYWRDHDRYEHRYEGDDRHGRDERWR